jgi:hypothetical protein
LDGWASWIGDSDLECSLREHLVQVGYFGHSAKFHNLKLVAVQRPGWLQVFSFTVWARETHEQGRQNVQLFGVVRQDERYNRTDIELFEQATDRNALFEQWSEDLIRLRRPQL